MEQESWADAFGSAGLAAVATLAAAFSGFEILESFESFWPGFWTVLAVAGALHAAAGFLAPRTGAAMAMPPAILYAWMVWAFAGQLMQSTGEGEGLSLAASLGLLAVPGLGLGAMLAGFVALGAWLRELRVRPSPYP